MEAQLLPAAFGDGASHSIDVRSGWKKSLKTDEHGCQTDPCASHHRGTQQPLRPTTGHVVNGVEVQTETLSENVGSDQLPLVANNFTDSPELTNFLFHSASVLEEQLLRNVNSAAFDAYDVSWEEQHDQVDCLHSLKHKAASPNAAAAGAAAAAAALDSCTAVAWNASGTVVAAAYGPLDRHDWPGSESMLCTWSIFRRKLDPDKADLTVPLQSCLTSLAFHPTDPSLLAGGATNGDVLVFNLSLKDDQLLCKSTLNAYTHNEPVLQLAWASTPLLGRALCSVSADGKLLVWTVASQLQEPVLGFLLPKPAASKSFLEGGACLAFSHEDPTSFVAGLEAGQLFKCSLHANEERSAEVVRMQRSDLPWSETAAALMTRVPAAHYHRLKQRVEKEAVLARETGVTPHSVYAAQPDADVLFRSPITFPFERHGGPVYGAHFSPFHRNLFLSVSTDSTARIYNVLQPRPVHVVEPSNTSLFACCWSPTRPLVFAVASADGNLFIYDLKRSKGRPEVTLKVTTDKSPVYSVQFNQRSPDLLATADGQGAIKIWRLSGELSTMAPREVEMLDRLAATRVADPADDEADDDEADDDGDEGEGDGYSFDDAEGDDS